MLILIIKLKTLYHEARFVPLYMRVFDQASHSICSICTCNHEVVVFYYTPSLVIVPQTKVSVRTFVIFKEMFGLATFHLTMKNCTRKDFGCGGEWLNMNILQPGLSRFKLIRAELFSLFVKIVTCTIVKLSTLGHDKVTTYDK